jgi:type I restriction enzyme S subunit
LSAAVKTTLAEVCESVRYGYTASAATEPIGLRFLRITDIVPDSLDWESVPYCEIDDEDRERFALAAGDIVVARTGATVGYAKLIREPVDAVFASYLVRFRVDPAKAEPAYVGRLVESNVYKGFIQSRIGGAAQPNASAPVLGSFEFALPPRHSQVRIADILSAYDDLIENNRRRMAVLEEAARQLYREWFVRLRFPGHEHIRIIDGVPERWEKKRLSDIAEVNKESLRGSYDGEIEYIDISSVTPGSINDTTRYDFKDAPSRARRVVRHGDIIWSCVRPNRRSYAVIWQPTPNLIASTGFAVLTPTAVPTAFLLQATTTDAFVGYLENRARGAAYPAVLAADFERAEVLVPRTALLTLFNEQAQPLLAQASTLRLENEKLRAARDLLLPRLMSGEIAV